MSGLLVSVRVDFLCTSRFVYELTGHRKNRDARTRKGDVDLRSLLKGLIHVHLNQFSLVLFY